MKKSDKNEVPGFVWTNMNMKTVPEEDSNMMMALRRMGKLGIL